MRVHHPARPLAGLKNGATRRLCAGLNNSLMAEIAQAYGSPTKKLLTNWISSLNYIRDVSAHHARLFNRKLVAAPAGRSPGSSPALDHLRDETSAKAVFGLYNALAIMTCLLQSIETGPQWSQRLVAVIQNFPERPGFMTGTLGISAAWTSKALWQIEMPLTAVPFTTQHLREVRRHRMHGVVGFQPTTPAVQPRIHFELPTGPFDLSCMG